MGAAESRRGRSRNQRGRACSRPKRSSNAFSHRHSCLSPLTRPPAHPPYRTIARARALSLALSLSLQVAFSLSISPSLLSLSLSHSFSLSLSLSHSLSLSLSLSLSSSLCLSLLPPTVPAPPPPLSPSQAQSSGALLGAGSDAAARLHRAWADVGRFLSGATGVAALCSTAVAWRAGAVPAGLCAVETGGTACVLAAALWADALAYRAARRREARGGW